MAGWFGFYAHQEDATLLHQYLNDDPEIAFLMQEGPGRWRALWRVEDPFGKTMLWHVPGGPLPLLGRGPEEPDTLIEDPFAGWQELREGFDYSVPYFFDCPATLELTLVTPGWRGVPLNFMPMSDMSWYGKLSLRRPPESTKRWWLRLKRWMRERAVRVSRSGPLEGPRRDIWAMPAALCALRSGMERDFNPLILGSPPRPERDWRRNTPAGG